ncbi:hypothetical protein [Planctomicrobium sp. SH664]|uniref:hypothetical protein n=1 Tax=Planctomicrobium sp. SH664 TaxID=3448125 RepID=UPI003F5B83D4
MADYDAFDPRLESLVVETQTRWSSELQGLSDAEKRAISRAIHHHPELAGTIAYERTHTGFIREITVTEADVEKLYRQHASSLAG